MVSVKSNKTDGDTQKNKKQSLLVSNSPMPDPKLQKKINKLNSGQKYTSKPKDEETK